MAKIVHLTSVATTFHVRIFKQCQSMASSGNSVTLLCTHDADAVVDGVRIQTVGKPSGRLHRMVMITTRLFFAALRERADIYVFHDPELVPVASLLKRIGKTVVYDMHENTPKQLLTKPWVPKLFRPALSVAMAFMQRLLLPSMPVVFAETSYANDYRYIRSTTTALNLPKKGTKSTKNHEPTLGYIGGVSELRGVFTTLDALAFLKERGLSPSFDCIGPISTHDETRLRDHLTKLDEAIRLHGYLKPDAGWDLIARCHIGLAVLKNIPNYCESFPGKMFEYMSFGLPVIVSDFPLYREVVDQVGCGLCVDPDSPTELADAIEWMLSNPLEAAAMGERGKAAVDSRFNWDIEYKKLVDFYDSLLGEEGPRMMRDDTSLSASAA